MPELLPSFLIFVGLQFLLFSTANSLVWRFFEAEIRDVFDWILLFFLFVFSEILLVLGVIGFLGAFHLNAMIFGTVVCFLLGAVRIPFLGHRFHLGLFAGWNKLRQLLFRQEKMEGGDWVWGIFGFLVLFGAVELFNAFIQYPWEYDTIAYHMPIIVEWIQAGSLWEVFYAVWGGPLGYYPSHHELILSWLILPFGNDYFANLLNFPIIAVMVVVVYKILREMKVDSFLAWLAGAMVMVMPIFLRQFGTGQVDLLMALGVLISWYYFLRTYRRKDGLLMMPLLLNMAIMLGTKYLSIIYIVPIVVVFFLLHGSWKKTHRFWWVWFLVILGSLGSMWYWRNLVLTGNPLFPASVHLGNWTIFSGYTGFTERVQELSLWHRVTQSGEWTEWLVAMVKETGWHMYLVVFAYALLIIEMVYKLLFSQMHRGEGKIYTLMLFFLPAYWYLYFTAPYTASMMEHNVRYAMPWLMLAMLMVIYVVYKLGSAKKAFIMGLMGVVWWQFLSLVSSQRTGDQMFLDLSYVSEYRILFFLLFVLFVLAFLSFDAWRKKFWWRYLLVLLSLVLSFSFFTESSQVRAELRSQAWQQKYSFPIMKVYEWLDENVSDDAVVANSLNPLYYPLYGSELKRKVRYININNCFDCDYFSYHQKGVTLRDGADALAWRKNLKQAGVDYLVLGYSIKDGLEGVYPYEFDWVKEYAEEFEEVFEVGGVFVYKVVK
jgi:hypothetical protein